MDNDDATVSKPSNLTKYTIPDALSLPRSSPLLSTEYQEKRYGGLMKKLLDGIEVAAGIGIAVSESSASSGADEVVTAKGVALYQSLSGPLQQIGSTGMFRGVLYNAGKISEHARFVPASAVVVSASAMEAVTSCAAMAIMLVIAIEVHEIRRVLEEVQHSVDHIKETLHNDRIGQVVAGIYQFQQALDVKDEGKKQDLLVHSVQMLNEGIVKTILSLKDEIQDVPKAATRLPNILRVSKIRETAWHRMGLAEETLQIVLYGIQAMAECYSLLDEPRAASHSLRTSISALTEVGVDDAITKSRMLPYEGELLPETPWVSFREKAPSVLESIEKLEMLGSVDETGFELEIVTSTT